MTKVVTLKKEARSTKKASSKKVVKAILVKNNKVLALKGPSNWELPGGHVHVGEEKKDGLRREVQEEKESLKREKFDG